MTDRGRSIPLILRTTVRDIRRVTRTGPRRALVASGGLTADVVARAAWSRHLASRHLPADPFGLGPTPIERELVRSARPEPVRVLRRPARSPAAATRTSIHVTPQVHIHLDLRLGPWAWLLDPSRDPVRAIPGSSIAPTVFVYEHRAAEGGEANTRNRPTSPTRGGPRAGQTPAGPMRSHALAVQPVHLTSPLEQARATLAQGLMLNPFARVGGARQSGAGDRVECILPIERWFAVARSHAPDREEGRASVASSRSRVSAESARRPSGRDAALTSVAAEIQPRLAVVLPILDRIAHAVQGATLDRASDDVQRWLAVAPSIPERVWRRAAQGMAALQAAGVARPRSSESSPSVARFGRNVAGGREAVILEGSARVVPEPWVVVRMPAQAFEARQVAARMEREPRVSRAERQAEVTQELTYLADRVATAVQRVEMVPGGPIPAGFVTVASPTGEALAETSGVRAWSDPRVSDEAERVVARTMPAVVTAAPALDRVASEPSWAAPAMRSAPAAPAAPAWSVDALPPGELQRLTDRVMGTIDQRLLAHRERFGRI